MEEIWFSAIWHKACFDVWTFQSDGWYGAPRSRVSMTPAASPTPTPAQAQRAEDQASSGGTCCKFFLPTRRPHEGSHVSGASPDTTVLRNMGQGRPGLGARAFGRCVGEAPRSQWAESNSETLLTAQKQNVFSVVCTLVQVSQVAAEACEQLGEVVLNCYLESVSHFSVIQEEDIFYFSLASGTYADWQLLYHLITAITVILELYFYIKAFVCIKHSVFVRFVEDLVVQFGAGGARGSSLKTFSS